MVNRKSKPGQDGSDPARAIKHILPDLHMQIAEAAELAKFEEVRRRALEQKAVQTQQLEELKVGPKEIQVV
jgi:hypothetical protein